jgi:curved DNA-binding protein CbpA
MGGALRLTHDRAKCVAYFADGDIIFAASNLKAHRFRDCLERWKLVSTDQLATFSHDLTDLELAAELVSSKILDESVIVKALTKQAEEMLKPALLWTEGEWLFDPRARLSDGGSVRLDAGSLIFDAARRFSPEFAASRLLTRDEILAPADVDWQTADLRPTEAFILTRIEGPCPVHELVATSGLPEAETLHAVYALLLGGFLTRAHWPAIFNEKSVHASRTKSASDAKVVRVVSPLKSGSKAAGAKDEPAISDKDMRRMELESYFARLGEASTHYEVLETSERADVSEIKRAYHSLARRFHPDRFHHEGDPELAARVEAAFARIARAYETLADPSRRSGYDTKLELTRKSGNGQPARQASPTGGPQTAPPSPGMAGNGASDSRPNGSKAEESFAQGMGALKNKNEQGASVHFAEAARLFPQKAQYRAYYGRALAANQQTRRQAEAELQAAIALDGQNPLFRVMLAELYASVNLHKKALGELQHALLLDPKNQEAMTLMSKLDGRTGQPGSRT